MTPQQRLDHLNADTTDTAESIAREVRDNVASQLLDLRVSQRQLQQQAAQLQAQLEQVASGIEATEKYLARIEAVL